MKLNLFYRLVILSVLSFSLATSCTPQNTVTSASPVATTSPAIARPAQGGTVRFSGNWVSGEHPTSGTVKILEQGKQRVLELGQDFKTSDQGPDLFVILHRAPDVIGSTAAPAHAIKEGEYVILAPLQRFTGAQSYAIPETINLAEYPSAAIWCRKFNATFGAARLNSAG